jgi:hypothetical protein
MKIAAWTADDVVREYGEAFLRDLLVELAATSQPVPSSVVLSVPPNVYPKNMAGGGWVSKFHHLKADPLPRRFKWPTHLAPWQEELLVLWWRADLSENALNALVESHRPMVVSMARRLNQRHLALLVEYGMLGLRIAATQQRPSKTKKGKMAGFDPAKGYRFSTYARCVAARYMTAAVQAMRYEADDFSECLGPRYEDSVEEFRAWAKTPIPIEIERERANYIERPNEIAEVAPRVRMVDYDDFKLWGLPSPGSLEALPGYI